MLRLSVIALLVVSACGGAKGAKSAAPSPESSQTTGAPEVMQPPQREQIEKLEAEIDASRGQLQLGEPTNPEIAAASTQPMGALPALQDPKCKPAKTESCTSSCTISDSICSNADKICKLASELSDDWARGKCAKANKTCEAAKGKCCGCQ